jgi:non-heme chloroperoxidase
MILTATIPGKQTNLCWHCRCAPGVWRGATTRPSGSKSDSGRWSHWDEIGWVHYPEIGWSHSEEIRWVQSREILHGFGNSSHPSPTAGNFNADRLADDVLAIIDDLKLDKPVLAGHSIAGTELSSICSRHADKVAGLIYLDAVGGYAFYSGQRGATALDIDLNELRRELDALKLPVGPRTKPLVQALLQNGLPDVEKDLEDWQKNLQTLDLATAPNPAPPTYQDQVNNAIREGQRKFTELNCPILAIFAWPSDPVQTMVVQAQAFETATPSAHIVRIPNAGHYVYRTNEADVIREMNTFMDGLPKIN